MNHTKKILLLLFTLCLTGQMFAKKGNVQELLPANAQMIEDIVYKQTPQGDMKVDIYLPNVNTTQNTPVMVYIHGGSWMHGSKDGITTRFLGQMLKTMLNDGIAVVAVQYRLVSDTVKITYPDPLADCKDAVKWVKANAQKYHFDANRMAVMGGSAGGHLSMMTAYAPDKLAPGEPTLQKYDSKVKCVVDIYGPTELYSILKASLPKPAIKFASLLIPAKTIKMRETLLEAFTNEKDSHPRRRYKKCVTYSPVTYVKDAVPTIVFHGTSDKIVPFGHTEYLEKCMKKEGKYIEIHPIEGEDHAFPTIKKEATEEMCKQLSVFLNKYL